MTTIQIGIATNDDDAYQRQDQGGYTRAGNYVLAYAGSTAAGRYDIGLRFVNVALPKDAVIQQARLDLWLPLALDDVYTDISVEAADDSDALPASAGATDVYNRTRGASSVEWDDSDLGGPDAWATAPYFTTAMQQHVGRAGWASGNDLMVLLTAKDSPSARYAFFSSGGDTGNEPQLFITYVRRNPHERARHRVASNPRPTTARNRCGRR